MREAIIAILAALPSLLLAGAGWLDAQAQKAQKQDLADNYRAYIEEQMNEKSSLESCMEDYRELTKHPPGCPVCEPVTAPATIECIPTSTVAAAPGD